MAKTDKERSKEYRDRKKQEEDIRELGRRYGEDEANRRQETGKKREARIKRAEEYAVWIWHERNAN